MGSGVPCVATRQAGVPEIVADGETGLLVAPHDPQDLGRALTELLADPARAAAMGRAAHARVLGSMTWEHVADRMEPGLEALAP
jgi:starch synthase